MALFESNNPTLSEKVFQRSMSEPSQGTMTVSGSVGKFGIMLMLMISTAVYSWTRFAAYQYDTLQTLLMVGIFGGLITGLIISFKPKTAPFLAPVYSLLEGLFIGGVSVMINQALKEKYPNVVFQAVGLTMAVAVVMFLLYSFRIIKPTQKLMGVIMSATMGIALFYLVCWILSMFHVNVSFMYSGSPLGIGISLVVIAVAALNLIMDFAMIEEGAQAGAPKYMEWYCAYGLMVTIVWLYIEILKLFTRLADRK